MYCVHSISWCIVPVRTRSAWFAHAWPKLRAATSSVYAAVKMPEYSAGIAIRFWLSLALPHCEYGAASMVRAGIPDFERTQANVGKAFINLWPGDAVAHSAVLMELRLWCIDRDSTQNVCTTTVAGNSPWRPVLATACNLQYVPTVLRGARMAHWVMVRMGSRKSNTTRHGSSPLRMGFAACGKGHRATS